MRKDNFFVVGPEATEEAFIGRKQVIEYLCKRLHQAKNCIGVAIIGLNRVGKTSLLEQILFEEYGNENNVLIVKLRMNDVSNANDFWWEVADKLQQEVEKKGIQDSELDRAFAAIKDTVSIYTYNWYSIYFKNNFDKILKCLHSISWRLVLCLDEFDSAREVFDRSSLGLIRNMVSLSSWSVTVLVASRRDLGYIERIVRGSESALEEAFNEKYHLKAFDKDSDMNEYWNALSDYDFFPDESFKQRLLYLTGRQPYLLSIYGYNLAQRAIEGESITIETLDQIYQTEAPKRIYKQYDNWMERIKQDEYLFKLREVLCGPRVTITQADLNSMKEMGYISDYDNAGEDADEYGYYAISPDFTKYFLEKTKGNTIHEWDAIMQAEIVLRCMIKKTYPEIEKLCYHNFSDIDILEKELTHTYPELNSLIRSIYKRWITKDYEEYKKDVSIVDAISLSEEVKFILDNWDKFTQYFGDDKLEKWKFKLELLKRVRNPLAHAHPDFITETERRDLLNYCGDIIRLKPNINKQANKLALNAI